MRNHTLHIQVLNIKKNVCEFTAQNNLQSFQICGVSRTFFGEPFEFLLHKYFKTAEFINLDAEPIGWEVAPFGPP